MPNDLFNFAIIALHDCSHYKTHSLGEEKNEHVTVVENERKGERESGSDGERWRSRAWAVPENATAAASRVAAMEFSGVARLVLSMIPSK
ncbi:hypothetical protein VNO80_24234 [Phaseolus coccineus]|uniref:Uncharacterized protein n=1 Tax=Phaseolus coccineus TaxID=3886 RepID=A0AAN9LWB7_PHACN